MLAMVELLLLLGMGNIVPLHVAFDRRLLAQLVAYLTRRAWDRRLPLSRSPEYAPILDALHFVLVGREQCPRALLPGSYFGLHFCLEELVREGTAEAQQQQQQQQQELRQKVAAMHQCTSKAIAEWMAERDAARVPIDDALKITHIA